VADPFVQRVPRRFVGSYYPRVDGLAKASGRAEYLDDLIAGMKNVLHARVLRSPHPHARILRVDTSKAEALPGVVAVLRYDDPQVTGMPATCCAWTSVNSASHDQMYYPNIKDHQVLDSTVRWVGDEAGVVVAAETEAIAEAALDLVEVEWEKLPFVLNQYESVLPEAPVIHTEINPNGNVLPTHEFSGGDVFIERGDVTGVMSGADVVVVEATCQYNRSDHSCLDTRGCLVHWEGDMLTCWNNYYAPDQTRMYLSQMTGLPLSKVRVINPYVGGNFGRCNMGEQSFFVFTSLLAKRTGRPVRYKMTRREDFHDTRNAVNYRVKLAAKTDGSIVAADFKALGDTGAYHGHGMAAVKLVVKWDVLENMMAHIPNLRYEGYVVYTNKVPGGCMRGIGNIQHNFAVGLAVDMLGEKLGLDPVEIAIKNFGHEWEPAPNRSVEAVLRTGAERIGWERRHPAGAGPVYGDGTMRGLGFSANCTWHAAWQEEMRGRVQVQVKLNADMSVILQAPMVETGVGSNACVTLACADALSYLGTTPEDIHWLSLVDTQTGLKDMIQTDSSCAYLQPELMPAIGAQLKEEILSRAALPLEVDPDELDIAGGRVFVKADPARGRAVRDLLWFGDMAPVVITVTQMPDVTKTGSPFAATFAEVEVDTQTGKVDVLKLVVVHDCGTVMYASGAEAQQIGGQTFGLGESLTEEIVYDPATGVPLNFNWVDYQLPTMLDYPDIEPVLLEVWRGAGEYGACGMGEGSSTSTPRAIANAVYNAIGVRIDEIPIKPDKVLAALASGKFVVPELPTPGRDSGRAMP
jgi:CO/xanthine dehydrogenase Mo-binding subunit